MLHLRIITALILAPLILGAVFLLPVSGFALFFWVILAAGGYEWAGLAGLKGPLARGAYVAALTAGAALLWQFPAQWPVLLWLGSGFWLVAAMIVIRYPRSESLLAPPPVTALAGALVLGSAWVALLLIRDRDAGALWLLLMLLLVWAADIGAYFVGRRFGRRALAPRVSPGKTWEGALGGAVFSIAVVAGMLVYLNAFSPGWLPLLLLLVAVSVVGDLFESVLKRHRGVKDSGVLLPGHGGALDRIDSMLAVLPVFALVLVLYQG